MRISDWSSDVCSSDLSHRRDAHRPGTDRSAVADLHAHGVPVSRRLQIALGRHRTRELVVGEHGRRADEHAVTEARGLVHERIVLQLAGIAHLHARAHVGPRSEEHTSELQSLMRISYAVFCLKTTNNHKETDHYTHTTYKHLFNH